MADILLAGVGGQGTVLASKILAQCAMRRAEPVRTAETIGMAQRGGCVMSHVRTGDNVFSPLIPKGCADAIIGFEPAEAVRALDYLKSSGTVVVSSAAVKPVTDSLSQNGYSAAPMLEYLKSLPIKTVIVDTRRVLSICGTAKVLNMALLGAACRAGVVGTDIYELEQVIRDQIPPRFIELNLRAISL